jgi:hypothetical protein
MNRLEALKIAKIAYKEINDVVTKWNSGVMNYLPICFGWDGCITVGNHGFLEYELREVEED